MCVMRFSQLCVSDGLHSRRWYSPYSNYGKFSEGDVFFCYRAIHLLHHGNRQSINVQAVFFFFFSSFNMPLLWSQSIFMSVRNELNVWTEKLLMAANHRRTNEQWPLRRTFIFSIKVRKFHIVRNRWKCMNITWEHIMWGKLRSFLSLPDDPSQTLFFFVHGWSSLTFLPVTVTVACAGCYNCINLYNSKWMHCVPHRAYTKHSTCSSIDQIFPMKDCDSTGNVGILSDTVISCILTASVKTVTSDIDWH